MSNPTGRERLALVYFLILAAVVTVFATALAGPASAAEPVAIGAGAGADWGIKASFRSYIAGPIANGTTEVAEGASVNGDGTFHFPLLSGTYDPDTGATVIQFGGAVHFSGHEGQLDLKVWGPRVEITPEGAALYAEVRSRSLQDGAPFVDYPNAKLADLDISSVTPSTGSGTTTWSALPTTLDADGVAPFAGFYTAGTAHDPLSFGYEGPGGKPVLEEWTAPGTPLLGLTTVGTVPSGVGRLAIGSGTVWASSYDGESVSVLDGESLATLNTIDVEGNPRNVAVDRGGLAGYTIDTSIRRIQTGSGTPTLDPTPIPLTGGAGNELAVSQYDSSIYTVYGGELHRIREAWNGTGVYWLDESWPLPSSEYSRVETGGNRGEVFVYGESIAKVTFEGADEEAVFTPIADTAGANNLAIADDGTLEWVLADATASPVTATLEVMHPDWVNGGYTTETFPAGSAWGTIATAVSPDGSRFVATDSAGSSFVVFDEGKEVGSVSQATTANDVAIADDGSTYVSWRNGKVAKVGQAGTSPTVTAQPADAAVALTATEASATASFAAAASGEPAPTVQWQSKAPGAIHWTTIGGATSGTLGVEATAAMAGTRYRAVFTNAAGSIASEPATLRVTVSTATETPVTGNEGGDGAGTNQSGGDSGVTATPTGPSTASPFRLTAAKRVSVAAGGRTAVVAKVSCSGTSACTLTAPAKVRLRVGGKSYVARVVAPRRIAAGGTAIVRVKLGAGVRKRLAGRHAEARFQLRLGSAGTVSTTVVHPVLVFPAAQKGKTA